MPSTKNASASLRKTVKAVKQVAKMTSETLTSFPPEVVVEKVRLKKWAASSAVLECTNELYHRSLIEAGLVTSILPIFT
jgi:hypothetical protein